MNFQLRTFYFLVIGLFFMAPSFAAASSRAACSVPWSSSDFENIKDIAQALPQISAGITFSVLRADGQWEGCSGSVVSDAGHILTASHCVDKFASEAIPVNSTNNPYEKNTALQELVPMAETASTSIITVPN